MDNFSKHDVLTLAAALAFYTALSLAPLLIITLYCVSLLGENSQQELMAQLQGLLGQQATEAIKSIIESSEERPHLGSIAGLISTIFLIFTASGVFAQLQSSLNVIFDAQAKATKGMWGYLRKRLLSMGMVITLGFLALVSLIMSSVLSYFFTNEGMLWEVLNFVVSTGVFTFIFALVLKYLPDLHIKWKGALYGGFTTALLFTIGKTLIGLYLGKSAVGSSYGAAGSLVVLLTWVYYSGAIVFTGAEITRLLARPKTPDQQQPA